MQVCDVIGISGTTVFVHTFSYYEITRNAAQLNPEVPVASQKGFQGGFVLQTTCDDALCGRSGYCGQFNDQVPAWLC